MSPKPRWRVWAVKVHRVVGLTTALFLLMAGLTGALLAFNDDLEADFAPELMLAEPPASGAPVLDPLELRARFIAQLPAQMDVHRAPLRIEAGRTVSYFVRPPDSAGLDADNQYFVDPYSGQIVGSRRWGRLGQGPKGWMPFMFRVHRSLGLGEVGELLLGIVALSWTFNCFVGAYLTFPAAQKRRSPRDGGRSSGAGWLRRWGKAWVVKTSRRFAFVFTFHRASGLWLWAASIVFAWSAVGFNLRPVYDPVMASLGEVPSPRATLPRLATPLEDPELDWWAARARGRELMANQSERDGFVVEHESRISYLAERGVYVYGVVTDRDISDHGGTSVWIDADTGAQLAFHRATGEAAGTTLRAWLATLHMASVRGVGNTYRVFVFVFGLGVATLSITGVWIWWRKRSQRRSRGVVASRRA